MSWLVWAQPVVDEITVGDETMLLVGSATLDRVVRLSALGQAIRELSIEGVAMADLVLALVERFGRPASGGMRGATQIVRAQVKALESQGVLRVDRRRQRRN